MGFLRALSISIGTMLSYLFVWRTANTVTVRVHSKPQRPEDQ